MIAMVIIVAKVMMIMVSMVVMVAVVNTEVMVSGQDRTGQDKTDIST